MPYLTVAEVKSRVGDDAWIGLTDDNGDLIADTEVVEMVQAELDDELNGYFRAGGYAIPLTPSTIFAAAKRPALEIANYRLASRGGRNPTENDRQNYEDAIRFFEQIAARKILLVAVEEGVVAELFIQGRAPFLTLDRLELYY